MAPQEDDVLSIKHGEIYQASFGGECQGEGRGPFIKLKVRLEYEERAMGSQPGIISSLGYLCEGLIYIRKAHKGAEGL